MLVTRRVRPMRVDGRVVHQVGLPYHWGQRGLTKGDAANDLAHMALDPNVHIQEVKAFTCDIRPGRRPRGAEARAARRRPARADGRDVSTAQATYGEDAQPRVGFFTDTTVCIGCKACEVACKEWNLLPEDGLEWTGSSYDNTVQLDANSWRHVAFVEQSKPLKLDGETAHADGSPEPLRWLMESDVCKHCTHAGCLDACPTGALFRTEFGTVVVQEDVCNGCGYCVPACPFGVIDRRDLPRSADDAPLSLPMLGRKEDGRVWKCTLCYDRLKGGHEPACAKACPDRLDPVRRARRAARARAGPARDARGAGLERAAPLRRGPGRRRRRLRRVLPAARRAGGLRPAARPGGADQAPAAAMADDRARRGGDGRRPGGDVPRWARVTESQSYYGRPILKEPTWTPEVPVYLFTGGIAGGCAVLHGVRAPDAERRPRPGDASRRRCDGDRLADPPDLRPRAARAVPEHAAGVQGHLADERRQLGARRLGRHRRASPPPSRRSASCGR